MDKIKVSISEITDMQKRLREINSLDINDIDFIDEDGNVIHIDEKIISDWRFTGLNTSDFIDSGFYKQNFN